MDKKIEMSNEKFLDFVSLVGFDSATDVSKNVFLLTKNSMLLELHIVTQEITLKKKSRELLEKLDTMLENFFNYDVLNTKPYLKIV